MFTKILLLLILIPVILFLLTLAYFGREFVRMQKQNGGIGVSDLRQGRLSVFNRLKLEGVLFALAYDEKMPIDAGTVEQQLNDQTLRPVDINLLSPEACAYAAVAVAVADDMASSLYRKETGNRVSEAHDERSARFRTLVCRLFNGNEEMLESRLISPAVAMAERNFRSAGDLRASGVAGPLADWMIENQRILNNWALRWETTLRYPVNGVWRESRSPESVFLLAERFLAADYGEAEAVLKLRQVCERAFGHFA